MVESIDGGFFQQWFNNVLNKGPYMSFTLDKQHVKEELEVTRAMNDWYQLRIKAQEKKAQEAQSGAVPVEVSPAGATDQEKSLEVSAEASSDKSQELTDESKQLSEMSKLPQEEEDDEEYNVRDLTTSQVTAGSTQLSAIFVPTRGRDDPLMKKVEI